MRTAIFRRLRALFILSLCICMTLGAALTLAQLAGAILHIPELVTASEDWLMKPTVAAAAAFGLLSFLASYFRPAGEAIEEDSEEI